MATRMAAPIKPLRTLNLKTLASLPLPEILEGLRAGPGVEGPRRLPAGVRSMNITYAKNIQDAPMHTFVKEFGPYLVFDNPYLPISVTGVNATRASTPLSPMRSAIESPSSPLLSSPSSSSSPSPSPSTLMIGGPERKGSGGSKQALIEYRLLKKSETRTRLRKRLEQSGFFAKLLSQSYSPPSKATSTTSAASSGGVGETTGQETSEPARQSVNTTAKASSVKPSSKSNEATMATRRTPAETAETSEAAGTAETAKAASSEASTKTAEADSTSTAAGMGEIVKARPVAPQPDPEQGISFKLLRGTQVEDVEVNITGLTAEEIYRSIFLTVQARASAPSPAPPKPKGSVTAPVQGIDSPQ